MIDAVVRRLARDQWVRIHGTPRVTVLAGGREARRIWDKWIELVALDGTLLEGAFDDTIRDAASRAIRRPARPIGVLAAPGVVQTWRASRTDRLAAMVDEGLLLVPAQRRNTPSMPDARSVAEATLFEALEASPKTAGRFELNGKLAVRFGPGAAEVDLLSRLDGIAIEIDGYHHFGDAKGYRRDRRKDLLLQTQGLLVIRILADDVLRDTQAAVNVVSQALAFRLGGRA